jgi:hypothetical protein
LFLREATKEVEQEFSRIFWL